MTLKRSVLVGILAAALAACAPPPDRSASLRFARAPKTPGDASVIIDEQYIGPLRWVAAHGVRLPEGEHRITIERDGYFPYDVAVTADRRLIRLKVKLVRVPD